ncbi:hypothetical protein JW926_00690 [Candidatus Sumerlaeota bacterium]|nr:hypothetical protein [Candidatus Sumerlaeota bacterium]
MRKSKLFQMRCLLIVMLLVFITSGIAFSVTPLSENQLKGITGYCVCYVPDPYKCPGDLWDRRDCEGEEGNDCYFCSAPAYSYFCKGQTLPPPIYDCKRFPEDPEMFFCGSKAIGTCTKEGNEFYCRYASPDGNCDYIKWLCFNDI